MAVAAEVGARRNLHAIFRNCKEGAGRNPAGLWMDHINGALGEMAVAKYLGVYWPASVNTFRHEPDIPPNIEVRTRSKPNYQIVVRPNDDDTAIFVLARGQNQFFDIVGWITGRDAKRSEWLHDYGGRPPAYFVPDDALHGISTLREMMMVAREWERV